MRLLSMLLLAGCVTEAATVEEGCLDALPNAGVLGDEPTGFLERANCFRGFLGLAPLRPGSAVQASVVAHRDVIARREAVGARVEMVEERPDEEGFTGATPFEREVAAGAIAPDAPHGASSVWGWFVADVAEPVDRQLDHPFLRDALFQPGTQAVGYAEAAIAGTTRAYLEVLAAVPSGRHTVRPIVYPKDGTAGVPTSFVDAAAGEADPLARVEPWGYPVTITLSTSDAVGDPFDPLGIVVDEASLRTEAGDPIEVDVLAPSAVFGRLALHTTVALVPRAPLPADTTFVVEASITGVGATWTVSSTFSTGGD